MPAAFPIHYVHDPSNGGLASAYNFALARAESEEREWLLLLDQDTSPTREFIVELLEAAASLHARPDVAAIVPKLTGERHSTLSGHTLHRSDAASVPASQKTDRARRRWRFATTHVLL